MAPQARTPKVLVVGDVMTDIIVKPEGPLNRGSDRRAAIRSRPGGSGANQAVWLGAMRAPVRFAARVGTDDLPGLEAYFGRCGIETRLVGDSAQPSGVLVTIVDPDGERSFLTDRGANLSLSPADLPPSLLEDVGLVVVSGYSFFAAGPRAAVMGLVAMARQAGIAVAVDPASVGFLNEVGVGNFLDWTEGASLLFANEAEALALSGYNECEAQMKMLGQRYGRVVIKRGGAGAAIGTLAGIRLSLQAPVVDVLDTTGAGDAFAAGFISAQLRGESEAACLQAGIVAGSEAVKAIGGQPQS